MRFWRSVILEALASGAYGENRLVVRMGDLKRKTEAPDGRVPRGIDIALSEILRAGDLLRSNVDAQGSLLSRVAGFVWGMLVGPSAPSDDTLLVHADAVKRTAAELYARHCRDVGALSVMTLAQLSARYGSDLPVATSADAHAVVSELIAQGRAVVRHDRAHTIVKLLPPTASTKSADVTDIDAVILSVRLVIESLEAREAALEAEIQQCACGARRAHNRNH